MNVRTRTEKHTGTPAGRARQMCVRAATMTVATAAVTLLGLSSAHADTSGVVGSYNEGGVTCYTNQGRPDLARVIVEPPQMSSSPSDTSGPFYVGGGYYGGGFHPQKVGYQATLNRWDGQAWVPVQDGPQVTGNTQDALQPVIWDGEPSTSFSTPESGAYSVYIRYYWFQDDLSVGGSQENWAVEYEQGRSSYCEF
jgi:hypothetical protein